MSDLKRAQLTSVSTQQNEKKQKKKPKTYRFVLSLGESNATTCPEYSFAELIKNEKPELNDDPFFEDIDGEVAAIAQRFEAKYGKKTPYSGKKKRTRNMDDFYDLGDGYDIDDPFIDNTEAYDEVIPASMTTEHGGFYINTGQLDFRSISDDSSFSFASPSPAKKKKKKNIIDSDSEEEEETGEALAKKFKAMKRKKLLESKQGDRKRKKLFEGSKDDIVKKKKKKKLKKLGKPVEGRTDSAPISSPGQVSTPVVVKPTVTTVTTTASDLKTATTTTTTKAVASNANLTSSQKIVTSSDAGVDVSASSTTSVEKVSEMEVSSKTANGINGIRNEPTPKQPESAPEDRSSPMIVVDEELRGTLKEESSSKSGDEGKEEQQSGEKNNLLPAQLPADLFNSIESIKKHAKETTEGKCKFFSPTVNKLLLEIEMGSYKLAWRNRTAIFNHLGEHLPCGKAALIRRAKKLRENLEEDQINPHVDKLKTAIVALMPNLQLQFKEELAKAKAEAELDKSTAASDKTKEDALTESDEDDTKATDLSTTTSGVKKAKRPRRKFIWTSEIKHHLSAILNIKVQQFRSTKPRMTAEEYMKPFLDTVIRPLWPAGWMTSRNLLRECKLCCDEFVKAINLPSKVMPSSTKSWPSEENTSTTTSTASTTTKSHVSKTEDTIEISSGRSTPNMTKMAKAAVSNSVAVNQSGASSSKPSTPVQIASTVNNSSHVSNAGKSEPEVIYIADSPVRTTPSLSLPQSSSQLSSQPKPVSNKVVSGSKQGLQQPTHPSKLAPQAQQSNKQMQNLQQAKQQKSKISNNHAQHNQQQNSQLQQRQPTATLVPGHSISTTKPSPSPVLSSGNTSNVAHQQAKVVVPPVSQSSSPHGQKLVGNSPLTTGISKIVQNTQQINKETNSTSKPAHAVTHLSTSHLHQAKGTNKQLPASFKQGGEGVLRQGVAKSSGLTTSPQHQIKSGIIVGTSSSHPTGKFPSYSNSHSSTPTSVVHKSSGNSNISKGVNPSSGKGYLSPGVPKVVVTGPSASLVGSPISSPSSKSPYQPSPNDRKVSLAVEQAVSSHLNLNSDRRVHINHSNKSVLKTSSGTSATVLKSPSGKQEVLLSPKQKSTASHIVRDSSQQADSALSTFERIQSQILSQEAMEGQALKNLALAQKLLGLSSSSVNMNGQ